MSNPCVWTCPVGRYFTSPCPRRPPSPPLLARLVTAGNTRRSAARGKYQQQVSIVLFFLPAAFEIVTSSWDQSRSADNFLCAMSLISYVMMHSFFRRLVPVVNTNKIVKLLYIAGRIFRCFKIQREYFHEMLKSCYLIPTMSRLFFFFLTNYVRYKCRSFSQVSNYFRNMK